MGSHRVRHDWSDLAAAAAAAVLRRWRKQWQPTPVFLPGKSHGRRSLVGCRLWCRTESDTTEQLQFHALEKEMATHSSILAWRIPGTGEPGGLLSMGSHRVRHDWSDLAAAAVLRNSFIYLCIWNFLRIIVQILVFLIFIYLWFMVLHTFVYETFLGITVQIF